MTPPQLQSSLGPARVTVKPPQPPSPPQILKQVPLACDWSHLLSWVEAGGRDLLHHGVLVLEARGKLVAHLLYAVPQWGQLHCQVIQYGDDGQSHTPLP